MSGAPNSHSDSIEHDIAPARRGHKRYWDIKQSRQMSRQIRMENLSAAASRARAKGAASPTVMPAKVRVGKIK